MGAEPLSVDYNACAASFAEGAVHSLELARWLCCARANGRRDASFSLKSFARLIPDVCGPSTKRFHGGAHESGGTARPGNLAHYAWIKFAVKRCFGIEEIVAEKETVSTKARERLPIAIRLCNQDGSLGMAIGAQRSTISPRVLALAHRPEEVRGLAPQAIPAAHR